MEEDKDEGQVSVVKDTLLAASTTSDHFIDHCTVE